MPLYPAKELSPTTTLAADIASTATTFDVVDGTKLPDAPNVATIIGTGETAEIIQYGAKTGNTLSSVTRGWNGTTAQAWAAGTQIARMWTGYDWDQARAEIENRIAIPAGSAQGDILYRDASGWTRLPAGTAGQFLQTQGVGANPLWAAASGGGDMVKIAEVVLASDASSLEFNNIPQTYRHLRLVVLARSTDYATSPVTLFMQFNGDTASNYYWDGLETQGGSVSGASASSVGSVRVGRIASDYAADLSLYGFCDVVIPSYTGNHKKVYASTGGTPLSSSGSARLTISFGGWYSTAAVTTISIKTSFNIKAGSAAVLYGWK